VERNQAKSHWNELQAKEEMNPELQKLQQTKSISCEEKGIRKLTWIDLCTSLLSL
jgi:hypothetical protein